MPPRCASSGPSLNASICVARLMLIASLSNSRPRAEADPGDLQTGHAQLGGAKL
jgi:hypothetical protein